jgi:DNA invertase Pin-like site-specific DNA recombinase
LDLPNSTDLATNKLIAHTLSAIAEFENNRRKERQKQGILAAQNLGKYKGRKTVITKQLIAEVKDLKDRKQLSVTKIARLTGKGRNTIYKILKEELGYIPSNKLIKNWKEE